MGGLVVTLVVVDAEGVSSIRRARSRADAADLRVEEAGGDG